MNVNIPDVKAMEINKTQKVTITAFDTKKSQCDSSPNITGCNFKIEKYHHKKIIALSRDLAKKFTPGDKFFLCYDDQCLNVEYWDRMNKRHRNKVDLYMNGGCKEFGVKRGVLIRRKM